MASSCMATMADSGCPVKTLGLVTGFYPSGYGPFAVDEYPDSNQIADSETLGNSEYGNSSGQKTDSTRCDISALQRAAIDYLARREHSSLELQRKLHRKFPDAAPELVKAVIERLGQNHLQSDERFTEFWVRYRQGRGFGYLKILSELKERGIDAGTANRYLFIDDDSWLAMVESLVSKRLVTDKKIEFGSRLHRKLVRFLQSRGFGAEEIQLAIRPFLLPY